VQLKHIVNNTIGASLYNDYSLNIPKLKKTLQPCDNPQSKNQGGKETYSTIPIGSDENQKPIVFNKVFRFTKT